MYKPQVHPQLTFADFDQSLGLKNRLVRAKKLLNKKGNVVQLL
ncbi:hypothetical protein JOD14_001875 [Enterococcus lemanii]|nr:hypothetical protein [Enterococcus lemanii]